LFGRSFFVAALGEDQKDGFKRDVRSFRGIKQFDELRGWAAHINVRTDLTYRSNSYIQGRLLLQALPRAARPIEHMHGLFKISEQKREQRDEKITRLCTMLAAAILLSITSDCRTLVSDRKFTKLALDIRGGLYALRWSVMLSSDARTTRWTAYPII